MVYCQCALRGQDFGEGHLMATGAILGIFDIQQMHKISMNQAYLTMYSKLLMTTVSQPRDVISHSK